MLLRNAFRIQHAVILHSRADDLVPFEKSEELVRSSGLGKYPLTELKYDTIQACPQVFL